MGALSFPAGQSLVVEPTWEPSPGVVDRYIALLTRYLRGDVSHDAFVDEFLRLWRNDRDRGLVTGEVIDTLMTGTDCYRDDPAPDSPWEIGGDQLLDEARTALAKLTS